MLKDKKNEVWNIVEIARNKERPNVRFYIENIFDDFIEFHGDRNFRDTAHPLNRKIRKDLTDAIFEAYEEFLESEE